MKTVKSILSFLVLSHFGRMLALFILTPLFLWLSGIVTSYLLADIFFYAFVTTTSLIGVYMLVLIAYAWVINPIRENKERKKLYEQNKK